MSCVIDDRSQKKGFSKVDVERCQKDALFFDFLKRILEFCQIKKQSDEKYLLVMCVCIGKHEMRTANIHVTILKKKRQLSKKWPTTNIIEK